MTVRVQIGAMRHLIEIRRWEEFPEIGADGTTNDYPLVDEEWSQKQAVDGVAYREGAQAGEQLTHTFTIRHRGDLTTAHVLHHDGMRYRILRVMDIDGTRRFLKIEANEEGPI